MNRIFRSAFVLLLFEIGAADNGLHFVNVTKENGIAFTHKNGMKGHNWIAETVGSGVGLFDLNGDGWLDIWLVQSGIFDRSLDCGRVGTNQPTRLFELFYPHFASKST